VSVSGMLIIKYFFKIKKINKNSASFRNILGTGGKKVSTARNNRLTREDSAAVNSNAKTEQVQLLHPR